MTAAAQAPWLGWAEAGQPPRLVRHDVVGSSNDVAAELARAGAAHGTVVVAGAQTAGRGRQGHRWHSPPGRALYLSVVLRPALRPQAVPPITLAAGIAVCEALNAWGARASIKWPNDVLAGTPARKVAGILTEMSTRGDEVAHVILGIGVNVLSTQQDFPPELREIAGSLAIARGGGDGLTLAAFERRLLGELEHWLDLFLAGGAAAIAPAWRARASTLGQPVQVAADHGVVSGVAEALDDDGALRVRTPAGDAVRIIAGELL
ncbi:MAG: biotin--[acetyl-CoA-carboxylase] ligase [Deltaproteobacteria bacterium]|nr:biotin--[acetyl-CoA-carboxylase] ligase [Deltaproteobacteria bacterium]